MQTSFQRNGWLAALGLVLLSLVPMLAGMARLIELGTGAEITAANIRFYLPTQFPPCCTSPSRRCLQSSAPCSSPRACGGDFRAPIGSPDVSLSWPA